MNRHIFLAIFIACTFVSAISQSAPAVQNDWTRIKDDKADFSILFPSDFLVDAERGLSRFYEPVVGSLPNVKEFVEKPRVLGSSRSVRMDLRVIEIRQVSGAKDYFWFFVDPKPAKDKTQDFQIGDFVGRRVVYDTDKQLSMSIGIALKSRLFVVHVAADIKDLETYEAFVTSLMLNGKPMFKRPSNTLNETKSVLVSQLRTTAEILSALNQKQQKSEIVFSEAKDPGLDNDGGLDFSRTVAILRRPEFLGQENFPQGLKLPIKIKVTFHATGKVGGIVIPEGLPKSFTDAIRKSATELRFLPAEIDGKKVDARLVVNYPF